MPLLLALLIVIIAAAPQPALAGSAQAAPSAAGTRDPALTCRDFRNRPVRTLDVPNLGDAGRAEFIEGTPVIMLDPALLGGLPADLQVFFRLHECAHHVKGHLFAPTVESEKEADCWAIQEGRKRAAFTRDSIAGWAPHFAQSRGSKTGHLPGPQRMEFMLACFEQS